MVPSLAFGNTFSFFLVESEIGSWSKTPQKKKKKNTPGRNNKTLPTWLIMDALTSCQGTFRCSKTRTLLPAANLEAKVQSVFVRCLRCFFGGPKGMFFKSYTNWDIYIHIYICIRFYIANSIYTVYIYIHSILQYSTVYTYISINLQ